MPRDSRHSGSAWAYSPRPESKDAQPLRLGGAPPGPQQGRQVVEAAGQGGVARGVLALRVELAAHAQGLAVERLRLGVLPPVLEHGRQVVEAQGQEGVARGVLALRV